MLITPGLLVAIGFLIHHWRYHVFACPYGREALVWLQALEGHSFQ